MDVFIKGNYSVDCDTGEADENDPKTVTRDRGDPPGQQVLAPPAEIEELSGGRNKYYYELKEGKFRHQFAAWTGRNGRRLQHTAEMVFPDGRKKTIKIRR
jgi:hypothetical protein